VSLRTRLVAALALLAAAAGLTVGFVAYRQTERRLDREVDRTLTTTTDEILDRRRPGGLLEGRPRPGDGILAAPIRAAELVLIQSIDGNGEPVLSLSETAIPVGDTEREVAAAERPRTESTTEVTVDDEPYRVRTTAYGDGTGALQVARSLAETRRLLETLRNRFAVTTALVIAAAAGIGWLIARQVTRRLTHLTAVAEHVAATNDLSVRVPVDGTDEAGRLGIAFDRMLGALARSRSEQQRLVQDAGHELRTPLTSLRTNISLLRRHDRLAPEQLQTVIEDLDAESRELTSLVNELVELATDRYRDEAAEPLVLGDIARAVAERAARRTGRAVAVDADGATILGRPRALDRAITNLVENALKFDTTGGPVEVEVRGGRVAVADRGPGIDPADLPHVFERFYRAEGARSRPGSGLGLSIVAEIAAAHGGAGFAEARAGGGAVVGFTIDARLPRSTGG
jgi:two-component system sensor histidine kinase MprB